MGYINKTYNILGKEKKPCGDVQSDLAKELIKHANSAFTDPKEKFINAVKNEKHELTLVRDNERGVVLSTKFGAIYHYFDTFYGVTFFPRPSLIPKTIIEELIREELSAHDYDNVAELYRFLSLSNEEKDEEGFAFYHWIWEDCEWVNGRKTYYFNS